MKTDTPQTDTKKRAMSPGIREILLAGVFWRILLIEIILLIWSVAYRMISEDAGGVEIVWYAIRILALVAIVLAFMMVTLRRFLERKIIRPLEAIARANRRLDVDCPEVEDVPLADGTAIEIREIVATRTKMLQAILAVSTQRLQLVNFIKDTFGRYLGHKVVDKILESPEGRRIGGRRQTVTVLMSDLRGFSDLSDARDPEEMVGILNRYLEAMTRVIEKYDGVIDEFIGDAILTVFGIPEEKADDPQRAVACALAMQQRLADLNREMLAEGRPSLEMGVGVNTGPVVVGNLGSEARTKYGIVGSVVNVASRIESNTVGGQVLLGEKTYELVSESVTAQPPMTVMMKGLKKPLVCYSAVAMGAPYNIQLAQKETGPLVEIQLPFQLWRLEEKKVVGGPIDGETRRLNATTFLVDVGAELPALTNVKLLFTFCQEAHCFADIYAKVMNTPGDLNANSYRLQVTYMDQKDKALLEGWIRSA
jgi:class 3 adenylate cyclase